MQRVFRRILGAGLILFTGAGLYVYRIGMRQLGSDLTPFMLLGAACLVGIGCYLLTGRKFFPDKEDPEQAPWRDDDDGRTR